MITLRRGAVPDVGTLATIVERLDPITATSLRTADPITVSVVLSEDAHDEVGDTEARTVEIVAASARWEVAAWTSQGPWSRAVTITQIITGGIYDGQGEAWCEQYVSYRALDRDDVLTIARQALTGGLPLLAAHGEL